MPGEMFTVPRGVEHFPHADQGTRNIMFEHEGTSITGDDHGDISHFEQPTTSGWTERPTPPDYPSAAELPFRHGDRR